MPGTLFTSLWQTPSTALLGDKEGRLGRSNLTPHNPSLGLGGQEFSWTVQSRWVSSGRLEHEDFGAVCATPGTFCCQESILHGQQCGEVKPPFTHHERSAQEAHLPQRDTGMTSLSAAHAIFMQLIW